MLKWGHMLILGFRELSSVFVPMPRLFQDTRKYDLFLRNSTCSKILSLGHSSDSAFIQDLACRITFFSYGTVDAPFKGLIICTMTKALLGSLTHQRHRDFSWVRKSVSLTSHKYLGNVRLTLKHRQLNCSLLRMPGIPLLQSRQISAHCTSLLPQGEGESHHGCCGSRINMPCFW